MKGNMKLFGKNFKNEINNSFINKSLLKNFSHSHPNPHLNCKNKYIKKI